MESVRFDQTNPMSRQFMTTALQNMQTQIANVKDTKDLKEEPVDPQDVAFFSHAMADASTVTAEEGLFAAANAGQLSELEHANQKDDEEKVERRRLNDEEAMGRSLAQGTGTAGQAAAAEHPKDEKQIGTIDSTRDKISRLRADVPDEIYTAANQFVQGQMITDTKPGKSLVAMKNVAEPAQLEANEPALPLLDIHDTHNVPMPMDMEQIPA